MNQNRLNVGSSIKFTLKSYISDGCSPVNDIVWGLQWPGTALNSTYVLPCPQGGIDYVAGEMKCQSPAFNFSHVIQERPIGFATALVIGVLQM